MSNLNAGDAWSFTYTSSGFAGTQTVTGTIVSGTSFTGTFTTPNFTTSGGTNLVFTAVIVTSGTSPFCQLPTPPANWPVNVIPLPNVTGLTQTTPTVFCSGGTLSADVTVANMVME